MTLVSRRFKTSTKNGDTSFGNTFSEQLYVPTIKSLAVDPTDLSLKNPGAIYYNSVDLGYRYWNGSAWIKVAGSASSPSFTNLTVTGTETVATSDITTANITTAAITTETVGTATITNLTVTTGLLEPYMRITTTTVIAPTQSNIYAYINSDAGAYPITLPAVGAGTTNIGAKYRFVVGTSLASGAVTITAPQASSIFGNVVACDATTIAAITSKTNILFGTGSAIGDWVEFTAIGSNAQGGSSSGWTLTGVVAVHSTITFS